jgi:3-hydroxyisobutyrate dehydrogenase
VDAPVSGGVNAAAAGTLTFMVGADSEAAFATAKQILESMGAKVRIHHGPNNYNDTKP